MIRIINTNATGDVYVNFIELIYMFLVIEFHIAMSHIGLYNKEHGWNIRRLFWYTVIGTPSVGILGVFIAASVKFLLS